MFTPVLQGNVVTEGLKVYYDFNDLTSYPGSGTIVYDLSGNGINGTLNGGAIFRPDTYGGILELDGVDDTISYTTILEASFTVQTILTSGINSNPDLDWINDDGAFPGFRPANNGFVNAVQSGTPNYLVPILWAGTSASTLGTIKEPEAGWTGFNRYFGCYTFKTNGNASHAGLFNNFTKSISTTSKVRSNSPSGPIYVGRDPFAARYANGRVMAYLHYSRELSDEEIYQNYNFFGNRIGIKSN
jgi:hypothetical protein